MKTLLKLVKGKESQDILNAVKALNNIQKLSDKASLDLKNILVSQKKTLEEFICKEALKILGYDSLYYSYNEKYPGLMILRSNSNTRLAWPDYQQQVNQGGLWLLRAYYSSGAFTFMSPNSGISFGKSEKIFRDFFDELKTCYNPAFSDSNNYCLYFDIKNPKTLELFKNYPKIVERYKNLIEEKYQFKTRKEIAELEARLSILRNSLKNH